jgi:carboxyl-terminal processing protease
MNRGPSSLILAGAFIGLVGTLALSDSQFFAAQANATSSDTFRKLNLFGDVFERVRSDYVEKPDDNALIVSAINGMLSSLDPHSSYLDPNKFKEMQTEISGQFAGLGLDITMQDGVVKVVSPIDDTPASRAGVLANDFIVKIDGQDVQGMTLDEAVDKMRGAVNAPITLTFARKGLDHPFDLKLVREEITVQSVKSREEGQVGYVRITQFSEQTADGLKAAIDKIQSDLGADKVQGYILDLRNNPGGLLDQAITVSQDLLGSGEIVSTRGRHPAETQQYEAHGSDLTQGKPIIVLVNGAAQLQRPRSLPAPSRIIVALRS